MSCQTLFAVAAAAPPTTAGNTYGVFSGGGYGGMTDVDACVWPSQPANPDCGHGNRRSDEGIRANGLSSSGEFYVY